MLKKIILILFLFSCECCYSQYSDFIFRGSAFLGEFMGKAVNFDSVILKDEALLKEFKVKSVYYKDKRGRIDEIIKYENGKITELSSFTTNELVPAWNFFYSYYPNGLIREVQESMFGEYNELYKFAVIGDKYKSIELFGANSKLKAELVFEYNEDPENKLLRTVKEDYWSKKKYKTQYNALYNKENKITEINYKDLSDSSRNKTVSSYRFSSDSIFIQEKEYSAVYIINDNRINACLFFYEGKFSSKSTYYYKENNLVDYLLYEEKGKKPFKKEFEYVFE